MITNSEIYNREIPSVATPSPESSLFRFHRQFHNNVQHKPSILYPYPLHCLVIATMISSKKLNSVCYFFRYNTFVLSVDSNKTATTAHINARSRHTSYTRTRTHRLMKWKYKKKLKIYRPKAQLDQKILKKYRANTAYPHIPHTPPKATHRPAVADSLADSFEEEKKPSCRIETGCIWSTQKLCESPNYTQRRYKKYEWFRFQNFRFTVKRRSSLNVKGVPTVSNKKYKKT